MTKSRSIPLRLVIFLLALLITPLLSLKPARAATSYPGGDYNIGDLDADNIVLEGPAVITLDQDAERYSIQTDHDLTIKGPGTLTLTSSVSCISCGDYLTICEGAKVFVSESDKTGISADYLIIKNATVNACSNSMPSIYGDEAVEIENGSVTALGKGANSVGILCGAGDALKIKSSTVTATGEDAGINAVEGAAIADSMVTITGGEYGYRSSDGSFSVSGDSRIIVSGTQYAILADYSVRFNGQYLEADGKISAPDTIEWDEKLYTQTPKNPVVSGGYLCNDDLTHATKTVFVRKNIEEAFAVISDIPDQTYTGSPVTPPVTVIWDGTELKEGTDYSVTYENNTSAGNASAKVTGINSFSGSILKSFKIIAKAAALKTTALKTQKVTVKKKTFSLKLSKLKKEGQTIKASKVRKGNKAKTKISYKLVKVNRKAFKKYFKVSKSGKITVKKKLKKGTYRLTIKATAAKTEIYKSASKNFIVTIKVKS